MSATRIETLARKHNVTNYINGAVNANLIGDAFYVAPMVRTGSLVNTVWKYSRTSPFRIPDTRRALGGKAARVDFGGTTEDLTLETHALDTGIDVVAQSDEEIVMNLQSQVNLTTQLASLAHYDRVLTLVNAAATAASAIDISTDDALTPSFQIVNTLNAHIKTILLSCGSFAPSTKVRFLWGFEAAKLMMSSLEFKNRVNGGATSANPVSNSITAGLDVLSKMLVIPNTEHRICTAIKDTGEQAASSESRAFVNDSSLLIFAASENPTKEDPSAFKTFWKGSEGMDTRYYKSEDQRIENFGLDWAYKVYTANAGAAIKLTVQA